jgi:hypothetical protein
VTSEQVIPYGAVHHRRRTDDHISLTCCFGKGDVGFILESKNRETVFDGASVGANPDDTAEYAGLRT